MTEFEQTLLKRIESLEKEVKRLKSVQPAQIEYFENLPLDAVVGKEYVAWRFGCSLRAVQRGEQGTGSIRRVSNKPLKFIKREVDAAFNRKNKPVKVLAAEFAAAGKPVRKRSIIK